MRVRRLGLGLVVVLGLVVLTRAGAAGGSPSPVCGVVYEWCPAVVATAPGAASVPVVDTTFNPLGGSYSYLTEGATLLALRNVADESGAAGAVAWSWQTPTSAQLVASPTPVSLSSGQEVVFVAGSDGFLYKLDAATGALLGAPADLHRCLSPCLGPADYVCPSDALLATPTVQLYDFSDQAFQGAVTRAGHPNDDLIIVATADGCDDQTHNRIYALYVSDLTIAWVFNSDGDQLVNRGLGDCALDYGSDTLYCGTDTLDSPVAENSLWAIDTTTGQRRWSANAGPIVNRPLLSQGSTGRLYVASADGVVSAFAPAGDGFGGGLVYWTLAAAASGSTVTRNSWLEVRGGAFHVLVLASDGLLSDVEDGGGSGTVVWRAQPEPGHQFTSMPVVFPGLQKVYIGRDDGTIQQLDAATGALQGIASVTPDVAAVADPALDSETDKSQPHIDAKATLTIGSGPSGQVVAQTFTPSLSGTLANVRLAVECTPGGEFELDVTGVTNGIPNGMQYATIQVPSSTLPPFAHHPKLRTFSYTTPAVLTAGTQYALLLTATGSCNVYQGPVGDPYQPGHALLSPTALPYQWASAGTHDDLTFQTTGFERLVVAANGTPGHAARLILPLPNTPPNG